MRTILRLLFFAMFAVIAYLLIEAYTGEKLVAPETAATLTDNLKQDTKEIFESGINASKDNFNAVKESTKGAIKGYIKNSTKKKAVPTDNPETKHKEP